jgi:CelD/BcsL family acetyltransferase involved in cellulose biosynthesis
MGQIPMNDFSNDQRHTTTAGLPTVVAPVVYAIDEAVTDHISQVYWNWKSAFQRDSDASPLQHPDFVIAELTSATRSKHSPLLVHEVSGPNASTMGVLLPKSIRTAQVGGIGPGWKLHGLRLAGGRFLGSTTSPEQQARLLKRAVEHVAEVGAAFLLIEDLDETSLLHRTVQDHASHGCQVFATHDVQPRRYIDFPATEAEYWATFSSRSLSKFRRNLKKFGQTRLQRITSIEQIPDFLEAAHFISKQSWQSRQFGLRIRNDDAELRQLSALAENGLLRSYLWWVEDKPAAFAICNQQGGCFRYEEIAYCAEFGQFSPGRTMLQQIVEDLLRHDSPTYLDFGGGDAEYKQQFANRESRSGTVWLVPPTWQASLSLSYLKLCRRLRSAGRSLVKKSGLATTARQWIRSRGAAQPFATNRETVDATDAIST